MGLIVDTSELIYAERSGGTVRDVIVRLGASNRMNLSAMTLAELNHGVRRADTPQRKLKRQQFLDDVLAAFVVVPIGQTIALRAGALEADLEMRGQKLPIADLLIAATALEAGLPLATRNYKHFQRIEGLKLYLSEDL